MPVATEIIVWLPGLVAAVYGLVSWASYLCQSSIDIYDLAIVCLYIQSLSDKYKMHQSPDKSESGHLAVAIGTQGRH